MVMARGQLKTEASFRVGMSAMEVALELVLYGPVVGLNVRTFRTRHGVSARLQAGEDREAALLQHDDDSFAPARVSRERVRLWGLSALQRLDHFAPDDHVIGLSSQVQTCAGERHILILDYRVPPSGDALAQIVRGAELCGWRGVVLETGSSYHFIGIDVMTETSWREAMGQALLQDDIMDIRYVGHALMRGAGCARLVAGAHKPVEPRVVALVGDLA